MVTKPKNTLNWLRNKLYSPYADYWFAIPFLLETFIFFPLDGVIALFCIERTNRSSFYTILAAGCSTIGAVIGYLVGAFAWETVGHKIIHATVSQSLFQKVVAYYSSGHVPIILLGGLLPLPFKMFTIPAGFCGLPLASFTLAIFATRLARYTLIAAAIRIWKTRVIEFIDRLSLRVLFLLGLKLSLLVSCMLVLK